MRPTTFSILAIIVLAHCSGQDEHTVEEALQGLAPVPQTFVISGNGQDTIRAAGGTQIILTAGTFVHEDVEEVNGPIQLEVIEVFDKSEMITSRLSTMSDGRLLESFGMIHLAATSGGKALSVKSNKAIAIQI